jgi:hypothetical protein
LIIIPRRGRYKRFPTLSTALSAGIWVCFDEVNYEDEEAFTFETDGEGEPEVVMEGSG